MMNDIREQIKLLAENIFYGISLNDKAYHEWLEARRNLENRYDKMREYLNGDIGDIKKLFRPMTSEDVECGQIVFGIGDCGWYCHVIEKVHCSEDGWKAYEASDGCRYGLYESYIFIEGGK